MIKNKILISDVYIPFFGEHQSAGLIENMFSM